MHPKEIERKIEHAATLSSQERHPEALAVIEDIRAFLPNSPVLFYMRIENLAALGRTNEALTDCERLLRRLNQIREAGDALDDLLDIDQSEHLAELVTKQTDQTSTLKRNLDRRQADALDKETLQSTVADLEAKLNSFLNQREKASLEQKDLLDELNNLREKDRSTAQALEKAYTELDELKTTLVKREAEISEAENELAQREQLVARLENEVQALQQRSENAVQAEELLNEELKRLKEQGDLKSEALEQARRELEELHLSLEEREKAVADAQAQNQEQEKALNTMREEMQRIHEEANKAENAKETLQAELAQLRQNERAKSEELETARVQLTAVQEELQVREKSVAEAEDRARETERERAALREQLNAIAKRAEDTAASEFALSGEVSQLRANEEEKAAELDRTRSEMERMRNDLLNRERQLQQHALKSELSSEAEKNLRDELEALRGRSREFAESEKHLAEELESLRNSETEKSRILDAARNEMNALREQLAMQQEAVASAEEASSRYDAVVTTLQQELRTLQDQMQSASSSEQELACEVAVLRENETLKSRALIDAQAEMEQLRSQLIQRETDAQKAEAAGMQKQRELEQLHLELELLRARTDQTRDAESTLAQEIGKLRQSEEEKNRELEQSRKELDALKQVLTEREEAASKASQEQEFSREIIQKLENELAAMRHRNFEEQSSQEALQAEVTQINAAVQRQGNLEDSPQAQKLKEIQEQLQTLEEDRLDTQQALREQAARIAQQQSSRRQTQFEAALLAEPVDGDGIDSQLFALNNTLTGTTPTRTQKEALRLAQQQSQRQTQNQAAQVVQQAEPQPAGADLNGNARSARVQAARQGAQPATRQTQPPASVTPAPLGAVDPIEDDDIDGGVQEFYPKPRDVAFVFPDQSCSIAVNRRRSSRRVKVFAAAALLGLILIVGTAAFLIQGMMSKPAETGPAPAKPDAKGEVKMLQMEFPADRPFGTLFDHNMQPATDAEWPPFATAQGVVEYPETVRFHLVVRSDHGKDLSPLGKMPPRSLSSLWLPEFEMTEENLGYLKNLDRISVVYIDQEMTEREREQIAAQFKGSTTITSKVAGAVVREMTPPDARQLNFPEGVAVGRIAIRTWNDPGSPWQYLDIARGEVKIPARMEIQLEIGENTQDLSFLKDFNETAIHTLVLKGPQATDETLKGAAVLRGLIALELNGTRVGAAGMEALSAVTGLQQIKITDSQINDADLQVLRDLPQLSTVEIVKAPNVTAQSMFLFRNLRALRRLHLQDTALTLDQVRQLARDLPACAVTPI